ncbi:putative oxidoreductase C-terminal domain-containing protein [Ravibacter arvi]|uniref:Oxidoreductase C-terminal domain-containing protein n=2 Tax=Ravibacter arvi TaxID=2051041 RepID=A0ABP8LQX5_9BACT
MAPTAVAMAMFTACSPTKKEETSTGKPIKLVVVEPGHFHAALVQKQMYQDVDSVVHVYATDGPDVNAYLAAIERYNSRPENPTQWNEQVYKGADFIEKAIGDKSGNLVILAGNNQKKTDFIKRSVDAGLNVLADKPMAINPEGFELLKQAFASAKEKNVLLYDIMTERYEVTNALQRELAQSAAAFGELQKGTPKDPSIVKESVHHFYKFVSGQPLVRPQWFYDVEQQGEGIVDVTTHLIDMIQWAAFPETVINYESDVELGEVKRYPTKLTLDQFKASTKADSFPAYLTKDVKDGVLDVYANGEINYKLKGVHAKAVVIWNYQAPEGTGDTHYSIMKGSKANLIIRQGKEQNFKPVLYIEPVGNAADYEAQLAEAFKAAQDKFPGIELKKIAKGWEVVIPQKYDTGHEAHFAQVAEKYMGFLKEGKLPEWEVPNMLTKYYITTEALKKAQKK